MEKVSAKIIGYAYVIWHDDMIAADLYEGNYVRYPDGNINSVDPKYYERAYEAYQKNVENKEKIVTAYAMNQRLHLVEKVPEMTADPEAADKEWYLRMHPQVIAAAAPEPEKPEKKGLFGRKKKPKKTGIRCKACGKVNPDGQKFCGDCGASLLDIETEPAKGLEEEAEKKKEEPKRETPAKAPKSAPVHDSEPEFTYDEESEEEPAVSSKVKKTIPAEETEKRAENIEPKRTEPMPSKAKTASPAAILPTDSDDDPDDEEDDEEDDEYDIYDDDDDYDPPVNENGKGRKSKSGEKKKKRFNIIPILLIILLLAVAGGVICMFYYSNWNKNAKETIYGQTGEAAESAEAVSDAPEDEKFVAIKVVRQIEADNSDTIKEEDLEGTILTAEQYENLSNRGTYIDGSGQEVAQTLIPWEDREKVIGQYATATITAGSVLYDTSITTKHIIADKTYVEAEVNGENATYEVSSDSLAGSTQIQIVALVSTDGQPPVQVLLSEMTLADRSLESLLNSAGQDILQMITTNDGEESEDGEETEEAEETEEEYDE
jgi:hypothetical protein